MEVKSIKFAWKGAERAQALASRMVLVQGRNGVGKSAISEALNFAIGRPVAGYEPGAAQLRGGVVASGMSAEVVVATKDNRLVTIRRSRRLKGDTFSKPILEVGDRVGEEAEAELTAILGGGIDMPSGSEWPLLTADRVSALLARLGSDGGSADAAIAARAAAKVAVKEAQAKVRAASAVVGDQAKYATTPREQIDLEAARGAIANAERQQKEADRALTTARKALSAAREGAETPTYRAALTAWDAREAARRHEAAAAEIALKAGEAAPTAHTVEQAEALIDETQAAIAEAAQSITTATQEAANSGAEVTSLARERRTAQERLAHIAGGSCPTCGQVTGAGLTSKVEAEIAEIDALAADAAEVHALDVASVEQATHMHRALVAEAASYQQSLSKLRQSSAAADAAEKAHQKATAELMLADAAAAHLAVRPEPGAIALDEFTTAIEAAEKAALTARSAGAVATQDLAAAQGALAAADRMDAAKRDLAAAEKAVEDAKASEEKAEKALLDFQRAGATRLELQANAILPVDLALLAAGGNGLYFEDVATGAIMTGVGLSTAQSLAVGLAIDLALANLLGRSLSVLTLEADACDYATLAAVLRTIQTAVERGLVHLAVVTTCHESMTPAGWQAVSCG